MEIYSSDRKVKIKEFIELLNELGYTIVYINSEFYSSTEFETPNESIDINESQLFGKDITDLVENAVDNRNMSELRKREIQETINRRVEVKRRFHKNIQYVVYSSKF